MKDALVYLILYNFEDMTNFKISKVSKIQNFENFQILKIVKFSIFPKFTISNNSEFSNISII